jgi:lysophospholipase L1-like esterase
LKVRKKVSSILVVGALLVSLPFNVLARESKKEPMQYVALGDSLAAGQTPYQKLDKGYADFLTERFEQSNYEVTLSNFGVSGYTSAHVSAQLGNVNVRNSIAEAEYVTLDIGANDLLGALKFGIDPGMALDSVKANLAFILSEIDKLNPNVEVYVMGYYNPFPYLSEEQQTQLLPLLDALNQTIEQVSSFYGDEFVPTEKVIEKHETEYLPNPSDIHLSPEGYQVVAKEFWKKIASNN